MNFSFLTYGIMFVFLLSLNLKRNDYHFFQTKKRKKTVKFYIPKKLINITFDILSGSYYKN